MLDSLPSHGSCDPLESAALRRTSELLLFPIGPFKGSDKMAYPLRSTNITSLHRYYEVVRPLMSHPYFRPRGSTCDDTKTVVPLRSSSWKSPDPIELGLFLLRSPPNSLERSSGRWFESNSCKSVRGALPHRLYSYVKPVDSSSLPVLLVAKLET